MSFLKKFEISLFILQIQQLYHLLNSNIFAKQKGSDTSK